MVLVITIVLAAGVFLLDLVFPLGVAGGIPYVAVVLASLWLPRWQYTLFVAVACSVLVLLGAIYSPPGGVLWQVLVNRALALLAIWVTAVLSLQRQRVAVALSLQDTISENLAEGVHLTRVDDGTIAYTNPAFERMFGYSAGELLGAHVSVLNAPGGTSPQEVARAIISEVNKNGLWEGEVHNVRKDGTTFWCYAKVSTFEHSQHERVWVSVHEDITARKQAEDALRQAHEELEQRVVERTAALTGANQRLREEIAERKQAEAALRASEERFRSIFDHTNDAMCVTDPERDEIISVNPRACVMLGYSQKELLSLPVSAIHPTDMPQLQAFAQAVARQGAGSTDELTCRTKAGRLLAVEISASLIEIGGQGYLLAAIRDITERKQAEAALRESEARLRAILEAAPIPMGISRAADGVILYANQHLGEMFGIPSEAIVGRNTTEFYADPAQRQVLLDLLQRDGSVKNYEVRRRRADGTPFWVTISLETLTFHGVPAIIAGLHDITARKQAEAAVQQARTELEDRVAKRTADLQTANSQLLAEVAERQRFEEALGQSEGYLRSVLDNALDGIITINRYGIVQSFNQAAEGILGYAATEIIGQNVKVLMPDPFSGEHDGHIRDYLRTGEAKIIGIGREVVGKRRDGTTFPLDLGISEMAVDGQPQFVGIVRDITERRRAEERTRELEQAERLSRALLSSVSHELRTPLAAILGTVSGLRELNELGSEVQQDLGMVEQQTERLTRAVTNLRDLSRLRTGPAVLASQPYTLEELFGLVLDDAGPALARHRLKLELGGDLPLVQVDGVLAEAVLQNLLLNAALYTPAGTPINIGARVVDRDAGQPMVEVRVADQGPGIPSEERERVFDPFHRLARSSPGTGLGLTIVRDIVALHGGQVWVEETTGGGATFALTLPIAEGDSGEWDADPVLEQK